jgi:hypothetical protein
MYAKYRTLVLICQGQNLVLMSGYRWLFIDRFAQIYRSWQVVEFSALRYNSRKLVEMSSMKHTPFFSFTYTDWRQEGGNELAQLSRLRIARLQDILRPLLAPSGH